MNCTKVVVNHLDGVSDSHWWSDIGMHWSQDTGSLWLLYVPTGVHIWINFIFPLPEQITLNVQRFNPLPYTSVQWPCFPIMTREGDSSVKDNLKANWVKCSGGSRHWQWRDLSFTVVRSDKNCIFRVMRQWLRPEMFFREGLMSRHMSLRSSSPSFGCWIKG